MATNKFSELPEMELRKMISDLRSLIQMLNNTIQASDACMTWAFYGRASRGELPGAQRKLDEAEQELRRRQAR